MIKGLCFHLFASSVSLRNLNDGSLNDRWWNLYIFATSRQCGECRVSAESNQHQGYVAKNQFYNWNRFLEYFHYHQGLHSWPLYPSYPMSLAVLLFRKTLPWSLIQPCTRGRDCLNKPQYYSVCRKLVNLVCNLIISYHIKEISRKQLCRRKSYSFVNCRYCFELILFPWEEMWYINSKFSLLL